MSLEQNKAIVLAEDDKVVTRGTFTGTHRGEYLDIPPTGKQVTISVVHIDRLRDGKVIEHWGLSDALSMMQQFRGEYILDDKRLANEGSSVR